MVQLGGFLRKLLGLLLKTSSSLIGNVLKPFTRSILVTLGLKAAAAATANQKKILGSGGPGILASRLSDLAKWTTLII